MGLLDRIQNHTSAAAQVEMEELLERAARLQEINGSRERIVSQAVAAFALKEGCDVAELGQIGVERYFAVGGIVLGIQEHPSLERAKAETTVPGEVLWQHAVNLVGIDRAERIVRIKIGTLLLLKFEGVLEAYNKGALHYSFEYDRVVQALFR